MKIYEGEHIKYFNRLFFYRNIIYILVLIFHSYLLYIFKPLENYRVPIIIGFSIVLLYIYYKKTKSIIYKIEFYKDSKIIIVGETFNKIWREEINVNETKLFLKSEGSKTGISGAKFYLVLKSKIQKYIVNYFENFPDKEIVKIFEEFKKIKGEKIIIDEKLIINRIQEKIDKCQ